MMSHTTGLSAIDLRRVFHALAFAAEKHRDQRRKNSCASPYINHPIALVDVLVNEGDINDGVTLCAAILHDTVEDTETTIAELTGKFGREIAGVVAEVTDDKSLADDARKALQVKLTARASSRAKLVKLADKICNLRDLATAPPPDWSVERRRAYFDWAHQVIAGTRGTSLRLETAFDRAFAARP